MISIIILTLNRDGLLRFINRNLLCVGNQRQVQVLGNLRANLCGIAIDSLTSGKDQIVIKVSESARDRLGCCPGVRAAENSVCYEDAVVRAHRHCLAKNRVCLGKSHRQNSNLRAKLILQLQSCFQRCLVIRIHDGEHGASVERSIGFKFNAALCIRDLLNAYYYFHVLLLSLSRHITLTARRK